MGYYGSDEEKEADMLKLRVLTFLGKKADKGVEKGLITADECKLLNKKVEKAVKKLNNDWWEDQIGSKSYDILVALLEELIDQELDFEEELDILRKVEKA